MCKYLRLSRIESLLLADIQWQLGNEAAL